MNCKQVREFCDPTLEAPAELMEHLGGCETCQTYVSELRHVHTFLRSDLPVSVPTDFNLQLQHRLKQARRNPFYWWWSLGLRYALPVAAMMLVGISVFVVVNRSNDIFNTGSTEPGTRNDIASQDPDVVAGAPIPTNAQPPGVEMVEENASADSRAKQPAVPAPDVARWAAAPGTNGLESQQLILRILDESNQQERLLTIPSMFYGATPVFASRRGAQSASLEQNEVENVF